MNRRVEELLNKIKKERIKEDFYARLKNERALFLYGSGNLAEILYKELEKRGIRVTGCIVDEGYDKKFLYNIPVLYYEEIKKENNVGKFDLLIANAASYQKKEEIEKEQFWARVLTIANPFDHHKHFDYSFVEKKLSQLETVYRSLADEESRKAFVGFINGRINEDEYYIRTCKFCLGNEFQNDVLNLSDYEVFIDIGAYQGAGLRRFINTVNGKYNKVIGIEAEEKNYIKMVENLSDISCEKKVLIQHGCWKEKSTLSFNNTEDKCCRIDENSNVTIEVDKIDNLCKNESITCVSLGIAAFELEILQGMKEIITKNRPKLVIFMGSAKEELYQIPSYIITEFERYKLYFRFQTGMLSRFFLYAIPSE